MDCRKALFCALGAFALVSGCQSSGTPTGPNLTHNTHPSERPPLPVVQTRKHGNEDGPARQPSPATSVAAGDLHARAAMAPDTTEAKKMELYDTARKSYQQALKNDPNYLPAQMGLARCYVGLNDLPKARTAYENALRIAPKNSLAWHDLSVVCLREKNGDAAITCLNKAIENDPENRTYQTTLGWTLARLGRTDEAVGLFARLVGEAKAHFKVAQMLTHMQQGDAARKHIELALIRDPQMNEAQALLVKLNGGSTPAPIQAVQHTSPAQPAPRPSVPVYSDPLPAEPQVSMPEVPPTFLMPLEVAPKPMSRTELEPQPEAFERVVLVPSPPRVR